MGRPLLDLTGRNFGRLTPLRRDPSFPFTSRSKTKWICRCDCGRELSIFQGNLRNGTSKSCGCLQREGVIARSIRHGEYGTPKYWTIQKALKRARRLQATPAWMNETEVRRIYRECPSGYDVDHIVPLTSPRVCGLHWEGNLQYLPRAVNQSKKNRYWPDMPVEKEQTNA
jgi:hypothetical protein